MTEQEIRKDMDAAAKEDRERFFAVADTLHLQPKYAAYAGELAVIKQAWRDMTLLPDYPNINWPIALPQWFPKVAFASSWAKDTYIQKILEHEQRRFLRPRPQKQTGGQA